MVVVVAVVVAVVAGVGVDDNGSMQYFDLLKYIPQCYISVPPGNVKKPSVFLLFQGCAEM